MSKYPAEAEPDNARFAPHHYYQGLLLTLSVGIVTDNLTVVLLSFSGLFAFAFMWEKKLYPATAASISTLTAAALIGVSLPLYTDQLAYMVGVLLGGFWAADDAVSHTFGVWTPVDWFWERFVYNLLS